jgi:hypothetical protein
MQPAAPMRKRYVAPGGPLAGGAAQPDGIGQGIGLGRTATRNGSGTGVPEMSLSRRGALALAALVLLAGCAQSFRTDYGAPVAAEVSRGWRLADVRVAVPETLTVSEQKSLLPTADIVWREDPPGDRRAQVAAIVEAGARRGAAGLRGARPVTLDITVTRFHALTFEAERQLSASGVHNIDLVAEVRDARTGEVLAGPERIEAALPALSGAQMAAARERGETQKSQITAHLARVFAGWLGLGPDPRGSFSRAGN